MTGRIKKQGGLIYGYSESYTGRGERERERERGNFQNRRKK
jgi:hypothetical protein